MGRKSLKLKPKPVLFIACEGVSSEYEYFNSWAQTHNALVHFSRIDVYPGKSDDNPKTTPYELYKKAKSVIDDGSADFAWIVFDKDHHPKLPETFSESNLAGIKIAFSSRSFEQWVLMHFQKTNAAFHATECKDANGKPTNCGSAAVPLCTTTNCLTGHIRRQQFIADYSKKRTFDLFGAIHPLTEAAIVNSSWLRFQTGASVNVTHPVLQHLNPYTDVDRLIFKLNERSDKIEWGVAATDVVLDGWTINASSAGKNLVVKLSHAKPQAVALNALFPLPAFFTTDDNLTDTACEFVSNKYILDSHGSLSNVLCAGDIIEYSLKWNGQPYFLFKDKSSAVRIYVVL